MKTLFLLLFMVTSLTLSGSVWFLSPMGNDSSSGHSPDQAMESIAHAMEVARPGDTLALLPGTYLGTNILENKHGEPNQPITIRSHSTDPGQFAIIDAQAEPSSEASLEGFVLRNSSWIDLEHLVFRNCWTHVIQLFDSPYISIKGCHFTTGKRVIHAVGQGTHHTLVEHCYIKHPDAVWQGWSWESLHHGEVGYYNGALLHPNQSGGGHIMRYNTIINVFNAFRTRPKTLSEDGNIEIYGNQLVNIRDNEFEPESFAWNMHYYNNDHINVHKMFSIDGVEGGNIYIYGNTYTQTLDLWALEEISGIFKYKNGPITAPCYAFNNSYYTEAKVLRLGESTNHHLKHFNNAYEFFVDQDNFQLTEWQPGFEFDYDCQNLDWPSVIAEKWQERHGLEGTLPGFQDGLAGDFQLSEGSACLDAGKVMQLPEFEWIQSFEGAAPDIGAFEGNERIDGPPFRFISSPEGSYYEEMPRISKYRREDHQLLVYFSAPLEPGTMDQKNIQLFLNGEEIRILNLEFPFNHYEMRISTEKSLVGGDLALTWLKRPIGKNGQQLVDWGSTLIVHPGGHIQPDLSLITIPEDDRNEIPEIEGVELIIDPPTGDLPRTFRIVFKEEPDMKYVNHIAIHTEELGELTFAYEPEILGNEVHFQHPEMTLTPGDYIARTRVGKQIISTDFVVK